MNDAGAASMQVTLRDKINSSNHLRDTSRIVLQVAILSPSSLCILCGTLTYYTLGSTMAAVAAA